MFTRNNLSEIRKLIENNSFYEAKMGAKKYGISLCSKGAKRSGKKYKDCKEGSNEDHIIPIAVLHNEIGEISISIKNYLT